MNDDTSTPTPRTDADERMAWNAEYMVPPETARKLERELTAMTKQRDAQAERIRYLEGATNHANGTPLTKAINQRDRLAMALQELCKALLTDEPRDITELLNKAGDALQSLTTPTQTETE
jgi:hypothetical protein